jgi:hypothetical protein
MKELSDIQGQRLCERAPCTASGMRTMNGFSLPLWRGRIPQSHWKHLLVCGDIHPLLHPTDMVPATYQPSGCVF